MMLRHGDRIVLGSCTMVFVFVVPSQQLDTSLLDELYTYWSALEEIFSGNRHDQTLGGGSALGGGDDDSDDDDDLDLRSSAVGMTSKAEVALQQMREVNDFQKGLSRVQRDILQSNAIGGQLGIVFEAHLAVGPLPIGQDETKHGKSPVLGMIPAAELEFRVKAFFILGTGDGGSAADPADDDDSPDGPATDAGAADKVVMLVDCAYADFADLPNQLIRAYNEVAHVARGLLDEVDTPRADGRRGSQLLDQAFPTVAAGGSSALSLSELKRGLGLMKLELPELEMEVHASVCAGRRVGLDALRRLVLRHIKLKIGRLLEDVCDRGAFALFLRFDLEQAARACGGAIDAAAAEDFASRMLFSAEESDEQLEGESDVRIRELKQTIAKASAELMRLETDQSSSLRQALSVSDVYSASFRTKSQSTVAMPGVGR
jgi:hypothetical protein